MRTHLSDLAVILLSVTSLALVVASSTLGASPLGGSSPRMTETVRAYYAALNSFLAGGDVDDVARYLPRSSGSDGSRTDSAQLLLALRSTFPGLKIDLQDLSAAGNQMLAQIVAEHGESSLPSWINQGAETTLSAMVEAFHIEDDRIVEHQSSGRTGVLARSITGPVGYFWLSRDSHLTVAELDLNPVLLSGHSVAVPGPGFALPEVGAFTVVGNGLVQVASAGDGTLEVVPVGEKRIVSTGDALVIPRGRAVVEPSTESRTRLLLMSMSPSVSETSDREIYGEHRPVQALEDVLSGLTDPAESEGLWFGTARVLVTSATTIESGWVSMDLTQLFVPPGESVAIDRQGYQVIAVERTNIGWVAYDVPANSQPVNSGDATIELMFMRACGLGSQPFAQSPA